MCPMPEIAEVWKEALPVVKNGVTGMGVWAALNAARPIAMEEGAFIVGLEARDLELAGHLRLPATRNLIEQTMTRLLSQPVTLRVIDGPTYADWETTKRRDAEAKRLQEQAVAKARAQVEARSSWETVYEQLGRLYASIPNKSLPQNRAKFYQQGIDVVVEARRENSQNDELSERNFARCLERLSQYSEIPSAIVAMHVLQKLGEIQS